MKSCGSNDPTCSKVVGNTGGCINKPYVIYLVDKYGNGHLLSGDSTQYQWIAYDNGDVQFIANDISASGLSGTFDIDLTFSGNTTTAPTNSPKYSSCFTVGSVSGWEYFTTTSGTITSTNYGTMSLSRKGPTAQMGDGANITQDGYGASGWFNITGGSGYFPDGDFNVMLSGCILPTLEAKVCSDDTLSLCIGDLVNLDSLYGEDMTVKASTTSSAGKSVTVEVGSYTSGVDCCNGNKPNAITYQYVSSNAINNSQTNSNVTTYTAPAGRKVLIVVSGNSNASDTTNPLYRGVVDAGDRFTVIRSQSNKWQANHYLRIMTADGSSLLQFSNIHISCSQPLISGDQYGTVVISSVTVDGSTCSGGAPDCEASITYIPATGFTGLDTVTFEVCTTGANKWCTDIPIVISVEDCNPTLNYCGKLEVTIDKNKVDGSSGHENFPVYLDLTHSAFKYRKNWPYSWDQGIYSPNGYDVQVCNATGDELPIEIVGYDSTSGNIKIWVKVDKLSSTDNTILMVKHGVSTGSVSNPSSPDVWGSDYKAVYHFEDLDDATGNDNDANNFGSSLATGQMGSSVDFDGNDYLRVPYSTSLDIGGEKLTMSAWVNVAAGPTSDAPFAAKGPSVNQEAYMFGIDGGTNPVKINSRVTTNTGHYRHDDGALGTNQWVFVQFVYDGDLGSGQKKVYVNGNLSHSKTASGNIKTGAHDLFIGKRVYSDNRYLTGKIGELRITCAATPADWISTEYNNQLSPTTFATITDSSGCGALPVTWLDFTAKKVSANDVELDWSTASEINNSHFEVERSFDGMDFVTIGAAVQGAGNSSQIQTYEAMDYNLPEGVAYYRVKQIDFDGQYDYTPVRVVQVLTRNEMVVYPNPANEEVNISFKGAKGQEVIVTSLTGQVLDKLVLSKEGFATLNTTNYPHGVYFIEVQSISGVETQKFTVQK